ncbi:MAG: hypothetical protein FOGNACKC_04941 [Anaerolineae bacterium]|nr:hypothetical protein [Anaerolineae bacterium]
MKTLMTLLILFIAVVVALTFTGRPTQALPEYAAQTGEPCATCHTSPSGGGLRTPRGQAWVGAGKPAAVPDLAESLALLGVHLAVNEQDYITPVGYNVPPAAPLRFKTGHVEKIRAWLKDYPGN